MSGLILVFTIFAAMAIGILCGFGALNLFFQLISHNRQSAAPMAVAVPAKV
ncbi:MAG TPA: hypothetical protein VMZ25_08295 [Terriglobales bacterium]|nr:hypothetical protein [Terriglobales bacterium]